ncbi:MAG: lysozyme [Gallionella sp.]|nr:lysozyme [Gallionella sp.]
MIDRRRAGVAGLAASATVFVAILMHEGYSGTAYEPVPGDVPTIGFGTTAGVKPGDHITPPRAVARALTDVQKFEGALKTCITVPLAQGEYDAFVSLSYNIGPSAFCGSTLVKKLNSGDYTGACLGILDWDKFKGKPLKGLTVRRQAEYKLCMGDPS